MMNVGLGRQAGASFYAAAGEIHPPKPRPPLAKTLYFGETPEGKEKPPGTSPRPNKNPSNKHPWWFWPATLLSVAAGYGIQSVRHQPPGPPTYMEPPGYSIEYRDGVQIATQEGVTLEDRIPDNTTEKIVMADVDSVLVKAQLGKIKRAILQTDVYPMYGFELDNKTKTVLLLPKPTEDAENKRLVEGLRQHNVPVSGPEDPNMMLELAVSLGSTLLYVGLIFLVLMYVLRNASGGMGMTSMQGKQVGEKPNVRLDDVQGIDEVKQEISEIVDYLKHPENNPTGAKMPRAALLVGPPGNGKTMLAKAIAAEAQVPFFATNGSEFVEMFVGRGAGRMRNLFSEAKKVAPCVVFIDEIDTVGQKRSPYGYGTGEQEQTLNQLLSELDGFAKKEGIVVVAATNRAHTLDDALMSRFNKKIPVMSPQTDTQRVAILQVHTRNKKLADDVDLNEIATLTSGFSGRNLADLCEEAARMANRRIRQKTADTPQSVTRDDFMKAWKNVLIGPDKPLNLFSESFLERVRAHEGLGHALLCRLLDIPMHVISAQPRGETGGVVVFDSSAFSPMIHTKQDKLTQLLITLGGMAAEEVMYGENHVSTGPTSDLEKATRQLVEMATQYGMFPKEVGLMVDLPPSSPGPSSAGSATRQAKVEEVVQTVLDNAYEAVRTVVSQVPEGDRARLLDALKAQPDITGKDKTAHLFETALQETNLADLQQVLQTFLKAPSQKKPPSA